jgi:SAM-dependent methyltransferase
VKALGRDVSLAQIRLQTFLGADRRFACSACKAEVVAFYRYGSEAAWGCPECLASPRERFVNFALDNGFLQLRANARVLHVAPSERSLVRRFCQAGDYVAGDIAPGRYRHVRAVELDLTADFRCGLFDLIYASHVLEHIPDDMRALRNVYSHLTSGGQFWALVPIEGTTTREGTPNMTAREREREFGLWDHVRQYGMDFADRLAAVGFDVRVIAADGLPPSSRLKHGLPKTEHVFVAMKA